MTRQERAAFFVHQARLSMWSALDWARRGCPEDAERMRERAWSLLDMARDERAMEAYWAAQEMEEAA